MAGRRHSKIAGLAQFRIINGTYTSNGFTIKSSQVRVLGANSWAQIKRYNISPLPKIQMHC